MAEMKKSEIASKMGELLREMYNLVNEARKNGAKVGCIASFSNELENDTECGMMVVGVHDRCEDALSEIALREPELLREATLRGIAKRMCGVKPSEFENGAEKNEDEEGNKYDKAADRIAEIIKGLKEE